MTEERTLDTGDIQTRDVQNRPSHISPKRYARNK